MNEQLKAELGKIVAQHEYEHKFVLVGMHSLLSKILVAVEAANPTREKFFAEAGDKGAICPTCDRYGKVHRRPMNAAMARSLVAIYEKTVVRMNEAAEKFRFSREPFHPQPPWLGYQDFNCGGGGEYGKLKHWGMLEQMPNDSDPSKKEVGLWRITKRGIDFVTLQTLEPRYAVIYDDKLLRLEGGKISIKEALEKGGRFNYAELMAQVAPYNPEQQGGE